jgi:hypothetical protein
MNEESLVSVCRVYSAIIFCYEYLKSSVLYEGDDLRLNICACY